MYNVNQAVKMSTKRNVLMGPLWEGNFYVKRYTHWYYVIILTVLFLNVDSDDPTCAMCISLFYLVEIICFLGLELLY